MLFPAVFKKAFKKGHERSPGTVITLYQHFRYQPHKMVKHTQTIRWLLATNCLDASDHFVELALKGLNIFLSFIIIPLNVTTCH